MSTTPERYNTIAIILHWLMAFGLIIMLISGFIMSYAELEKSLTFKLYQWHKGGGVLLLIAAFLRVAWRFASKVPSLPESFKGLEKLAAKAGHIGLYVLMFAMPISGWFMVSSSVYGLPTIVFGLFEWPHIPGVQSNEAVNGAAKSAHFVLGLLFVAFILGHVAAVIKHIIIDKENLLPRMWFGKTKE